MKTSKILLLLAAAAFVSLFLGQTFASFFGNTAYALPIAGVVFVTCFIPKTNHLALFEVTPDLSALTTAFVKFGGKILRKHVNELELGDGVTIYRGVKVPVAMTKLSAKGNPRPYRENDDTTGNGAKFTDRTLTVYQSKWDFDVDPEQFRNKYLNDVTGAPFYQYILDQVGTEYMAAINDSVLFNGVYNATGTTAAAIANGWNTLFKALVTATTLVPKVVGAITGANAVTKVETFASAQPAWWRKKGFVIKCSYATFDAYKTHYRTLNGFGFQPRANGEYYLDGFKDVRLQPVSWIPNDGLLGVVYDALAFGTDGDRIQVAASTRRNIIEVRLMMPVGLEIEDIDCISVSDNLVA
ncbi:hypothetical protein GCM10023149_30910 [Mucilaginibacter gynuensis]|uniref:Uncharacterized protein n=1 Tax=Mucilaginibacter gynuensis TaxID=1302236 RepID=A0ABP8GNY4_9SPHI